MYMYAAVSCGELSNPENGNVVVSSSLFRGTATYSCNTNFELVNGLQVRMCQANETWSEIAPTCQGEKTLYYKVSESVQESPLNCHP